MWIEIHDAWTAEGFAEMYLIRYSEIALKSPPVRRRWEDILVSHLHNALPNCRISRSWGRIWIEGDVDHEKLKKVFGIVSFSKCEHCCLEDLDSFIPRYCHVTDLEKA